MHTKIKVSLLSKLFQTTPSPLKFRSTNKGSIFNNALYILYTITKMTSKKFRFGVWPLSPLYAKYILSFFYFIDDLPNVVHILFLNGTRIRIVFWFMVFVFIYAEYSIKVTKRYACILLTIRKHIYTVYSWSDFFKNIFFLIQIISNVA